MRNLIFASLLLIHEVTSSVCTDYGNPLTDWLTTPCPIPSTFTAVSNSSFFLTNGIVSRTFTLDTSTGYLASTSLRSEAAASTPAPYNNSLLVEKLVASVAESSFEINGIPVLVGGGQKAAAAEAVGEGGGESENCNGIVGCPSTTTTASSSSAPFRFTFQTYRSNLTPVAGNFTFTPGSRGSVPNKSWPPKGTRVEFDHVAPCSYFGSARNNHESNDNNNTNNLITATIIYELYDGTSAFGRRIQITHTCDFPLYIFNMTVSMLALRGGGIVDTYTDAAISEGAIASLDNQSTVFVNRFLPITASHSYDADIPLFGPGISNFLSSDPPFISYLCVEVIHNAPSPFSPELPHGFTRYGLEVSRAWRTLAPQTEQFPLVGNAMCVGGATSLPPGDPAVGSWCYDDAGTAALEAYIDQAAAIGFEAIDISVNMNATWRSQIGVEFQSSANMTWFKALVDRAKASNNMEMGAYQLLRNARSATAINECAPNNAFLLPNDGYDDMDLLPPYGTGLSCHNGGSSSCTGGPGCCSVCAANEWFDTMVASVFDFWDTTGMTFTEQDGAESNSPCANESHIHHHGLNDSVWVKWNKIHDVFKGYLNRNGFIQGMPGHWLEGGQSKVPGGYDEMTWSLPRWTWIHRQRERMIADPQDRDRITPNALRYFVTPFTPYHPEEVGQDGNGNAIWIPVIGLESSATLEPLEEHTVELNWALSQTFGTGIFSNLRGWRLFGGPQSQAVMLKWSTFVKKYRRIIGTDFLTLNVGTVCWGSGATLPNATCTVSSYDAILHRAPINFYPDITERALAMVWNPLNTTTIVTNLNFPMYYAGFMIPYTSGNVTVRQEEDGVPFVLPLDNAINNTIHMPVITLQPLQVTYFVLY